MEDSDVDCSQEEQTIFTPSPEETSDFSRLLWSESVIMPSSQESDLTTMSPLECYFTPVSPVSVNSAVIEVELEDVKEDSASVEDNFEATSKMPSVDKFPGAGRFHVQFEGSEKHSHYSSELNKMFVKNDVKVPFKFVWDWEKNLVSSPKVRAVLIFKSADMMEKTIESCHEHALLTSECNQRLSDKSHANHVVRCEHDLAQYCANRLSGRLSVVAPLDHPQSGAGNTTIMYSFVCRSSCSGKKGSPTLIVFTLEDSLGKVYGRDLLHIQVSASPKRDKMKAESFGKFKSAKQSCSDKRLSTSTSTTTAKQMKFEENADMGPKNVQSEMSPVFLGVPVLNEAHRERVMDFAYADILLRIDKDQREPTLQELQLIRHYRNIQSLEQDTE